MFQNNLFLHSYRWPCQVAVVLLGCCDITTGTSCCNLNPKPNWDGGRQVFELREPLFGKEWWKGQAAYDRDNSPAMLQGRELWRWSFLPVRCHHRKPEWFWVTIVFVCLLERVFLFLVCGRDAYTFHVPLYLIAKETERQVCHPPVDDWCFHNGSWDLFVLFCLLDTESSLVYNSLDVALVLALLTGFWMHPVRGSPSRQTPVQLTILQSSPHTSVQHLLSFTDAYVPPVSNFTECSRLFMAEWTFDYKDLPCAIVV